MRRAALAIVGVMAVVGCGRIGYDPAIDAGAGAGELRYPTDDVAAVVNATVIDLRPVASPPGATFTIAPALPLGVVLDADSGAILGVPTAAADAMFTVTARAAAGVTAEFELRLTALPGWIVDVTGDQPDDDGGADTTCLASAAGGCTLRAAFQTANQRTLRQLILVPAGAYAIGASLGVVTNDVVIAGAGATATIVRAATFRPGFRAYGVTSAHTLALRGTTYRDFGNADGAVVHATAGRVEIDDCHFAANASAGSGGVLFASDGAVVVARDSLFIDNESFGGCCSGWGGVIDGEGPGTTIDVEGCTATGNTSAWGSFAHITSGTNLRLINSTLARNVATIAGALASPGGHYLIVNSTIVANTNTRDDAAGLYVHASPARYQLVNTIVAGNTDASGAEHDCRKNDPATVVTSLGGNLIGDAAGNCAASFDQPSDRLSTDPLLEPGAPSDHGGPTPTLLLQAGSPAHAAGVSAQCPPRDQRGRPRPPGAACDLGATETP